MSKSTPDDPTERPEFMAMLGLLPPYTTEDVKQAYMRKAKSAHPDLAGDPRVFRKIQEAYEQAQQFAAPQ